MYVCMFWIVLLYTYTLSAHTGCDYTYIHNDMVDLASVVYIPTHSNHIACMLTWSGIYTLAGYRLVCILYCQVAGSGRQFAYLPIHYECLVNCSLNIIIIYYVDIGPNK